MVFRALRPAPGPSLPWRLRGSSLTFYSKCIRCFVALTKGNSKAVAAAHIVAARQEQCSYVWDLRRPAAVTVGELARARREGLISLGI